MKLICNQIYIIVNPKEDWLDVTPDVEEAEHW